MEDDLNFLIKGRQPQVGQCKTTWFFVNGR
jgi:hypothetical protein